MFSLSIYLTSIQDSINEWGKNKMEEIIEDEEEITQFASIELKVVMIEGEWGEDILECEGDREDQAEVMFEEEMRRLRKNCVSGSSQKSYISAIIAMIFFLNRSKTILTLNTVLSDLIVGTFRQ